MFQLNFSLGPTSHDFFPKQKLFDVCKSLDVCLSQSRVYWELNKWLITLFYLDSEYHTDCTSAFKCMNCE